MKKLLFLVFTLVGLMFDACDDSNSGGSQTKTDSTYYKVLWDPTLQEMESSATGF